MRATSPVRDVYRGACFPVAACASLIALAACNEDVPPDQGLAAPADDGFGACDRADGVARSPIIGAPELCGSCDPNCFQTLDAPVDGDLTDDNAENVVYDEAAGGLVLVAGSSTGGRYAFIANAPESTVSKFSLETAEEVGRYLVGRPAGLCSGMTGGCNQPSRTAVDSRGFGYVASRAFGGQGSVTKLAGDVATCVDREPNGTITTSTGSLPLGWGLDECVIWTVDVGGSDAIPRALAIDARDRLWVGLYNEHRFSVRALNDGHEIASVSVAGNPAAVDAMDREDGQPYGAAIAGDGKLWYVDEYHHRSWIGSIDTKTDTPGRRVANTSACPGSYGIAVDTKARVIIGGDPTNCIARFDPADDTWRTLWTKQAKTATRGVTVDASDAMWTVAHDNINANGPHWISRFLEDGSELIYTVPGCGIPIGLAADFSGNMWTVCNHSEKIAKINIASGHTKTYKTGAGPYTYSDFTGFIRATITAPEGHYVRLHDADVVCTDDREPIWSQLYFEVETPAGTSVEFVGRTAETTDALQFAPEVLLVQVPSDRSPGDVAQALELAGVANQQRYMEVRVVLRGSGASPVFTSMTLVHYCRCECDTDAACSSSCACDEDCT